MMSFRKVAAPAFAAIIGLTEPALAQAERASVIGTITDNSGSAMAGVEVEVTNEATNTTRRLATDSAGSYTAVNLIPGTYTIRQRSPVFGNRFSKIFSSGVTERKARHHTFNRSCRADNRSECSRSAGPDGERLSRSGDQLRGR